MKIIDRLRKEIFEAVGAVYPEMGVKLEDIELEHPTVEEFGDYSTNIALKLKIGNPAEVAEKIVACLKPKQGSNPCKVAGGFINFTLDKEFLIGEMEKINEEYGKSDVGKGKTVVIDYSAPNIAKRFGIGHLRSTIIGQALYNLYKFLDYTVIGDNHLGDWGTQFGKILYMIETRKPKELTVELLEELYVEFHKMAEADPNIEEKGRAWFRRLEDGDSGARELWQKCVDISMEEFNRVYDLLEVKIDYCYGESFYENKMQEIVEEARGISKKSGGALIIETEGIKTPLILLKSDGGTTYATRDLATLKFRKEKWDPDIIIYEVGGEQALHFQQVFAVARKLGYAKPETQLIHTKHGLYRLEHGKMKTREGTTVKLEEILSEAIKRAEKLGSKETARAVGIGAVKYFDLKHNVQNDIVFDWEKMFALQGDSGPYLQYTYARAKSVLRKANDCHPELGSGSPGLSGHSHSREIPPFGGMTNEELAILRYLYRFPEVVEAAAKQYSPNFICSYLFELAKRFNNFYNSCRILDQDEGFRIELTGAVSVVLKSGLNLLGIEAPEKM